MINKNSTEHLNSYLPEVEEFTLNASERYLVIPITNLPVDEVLTAEEWGSLALSNGFILYKEEELTTPSAVDKLISSLAKDDGYYYSWQANIAMAFKDEYDSVVSNITSDRSLYVNIHEIANQAAKRFLNQLINAKSTTSSD